MNPIQFVGYIILTVVTCYGTWRTATQFHELIKFISELVALIALGVIGYVACKYPDDVVAYLFKSSQKALDETVLPAVTMSEQYWTIAKTYFFKFQQQ